MANKTRLLKMLSEDSPTMRYRVSGEDRQRQLIEAAIDVIGSKGLSRTTLADIAKKAGLAYGHISFRFKTKESLLLAALRAVTDEYVAVRDAAVALEDRPAAERLRLMIEAGFQRNIASKKKIALWHAFLSECHTRPAYMKLFSEIRKAEYGRARKICDELLSEGTDSALDPHVAALGINSLVEGLWFNMRLKPGAIDSTEALVIANAFLAAIYPDRARFFISR
ncbi:TetR family transcriptional regulator C-terminal domain-containing protein [Mesorhizobium sp. WSM4976]|uniref:TetR family transcriptional regulator C-terminal domain-containing protein n=1 Tax=Mesorhizobium sp. WSM4976 TaxID=3038549 RepID=UPI002416EA75|nr:TetR family transcriptional regulator C-terminal domain-containing protein [Mesorhizobium sp. WSM4976]MDG4898450.1 TetR family transcriptional regulator C-terminal domain-containing protein [Mesorhizobium sp. WSM4976]